MEDRYKRKAINHLQELIDDVVTELSYYDTVDAYKNSDSVEYIRQQQLVYESAKKALLASEVITQDDITGIETDNEHFKIYGTLFQFRKQYII